METTELLQMLKVTTMAVETQDNCGAVTLPNIFEENNNMAAGFTKHSPCHNLCGCLWWSL